MFLLSCIILVAYAQVSGAEVPKLVTEHVDGAQYAVGMAMQPETVARKTFRNLQDFQQMPDKSQGPQGNYTMEEVATYDGEDGRLMYIVIDGEVYDVTMFADLHPGGPEPLKAHVGKDATVAVRASGMGPLFHQVLHLFRVGQVVGPLPKDTLAEAVKSRL